MSTELIAEEVFAFAKRVARRMTKDVEADSIAGISTRRVLEHYDGRIHWKRYVAYVVRMDVYAYWRKLKRRAEQTLPQSWWEEEVYVLPEDCRPLIDLLPEDAKLLHEYHVEGWCLDVVARRYGVSVYGARKMLRAAEQRLYEAGVEAGLVDPTKPAEKVRGPAFQRLARLSARRSKDASQHPRPIAKL